MQIEHFTAHGKQISIVGTGHVLRESVNAVKKEIKDFQPDTVAIELDMNRFLALEKRKRVKPKKLVERLLYELQKQAGQTTGISPGAEMKAAAREAGKHRIPVALIDRDIRITLNRALRNITFKEKLKLLYGILGGFIEVRDKRKLDTLIDQKDELMIEFEKELPSVYKALVTERDTYMARAILTIPANKIMVVVGAGHTTGIKKQLEYRK